MHHLIDLVDDPVVQCNDASFSVMLDVNGGPYSVLRFILVLQSGGDWQILCAVCIVLNVCSNNLLPASHPPYRS